MNENARAAYITAQAAMLNAEIALGLADNQSRISRGLEACYGDDYFAEVINRYSSDLRADICQFFLMNGVRG